MIRRIGPFAEAGLALSSTLARQSESDSNLKRAFQFMANEYYTGDPKYHDVYQAVRNFAQEAISVQSGTGRFYVTSVNQMVEHMLATRSPGQIRQQMLVDMYPSLAMLQGLNDTWQRETKLTSNAPMYDPRAARMLDALVRSNGYTGAVPTDAPDRLQALNKTVDPKDRPKWLQPWMERPPLTREEVDYWRTWAEENPKDPSAPDIIRRLGIIPDTRAARDRDRNR